MLNRILPRHADNTYSGYKLALWLFAILVFMRSVMSLMAIFNGRVVVTTADGIPIDAFTPGGAQTVVSLFALLGLSNLVICVICIVVLVRYRALVPLMFMLLLLQHAARKLIVQAFPIERVGAPPASMINLVLLALMVVGLGLSLLSRDRRQVAGM